MSDVYFAKKIEGLLEHLPSGLKGKIGIKVHFGEKGCETFIKPEIVGKIYNSLKEKNPEAEINLVECNVLYRGSRTKTEDHIKTAREHGFNEPIEILDESGSLEIPVNLMHFKKVKAGKNLKDYETLIIVSHVKGHMMAGFGGALKNVGMGIASRAGKLELHAGVSPKINSKCTGCGACIKECPVNAIILELDKAAIDKEKCIGCASCIAACTYGAVEIPWGARTSEEIQERICEYCSGILKGRKVFYINFLGNITKDCDCIGKKQKPLMKDIGFLFSEDIVSIDKASYDLIEKEGNFFKETWPGINSQHQFEYAERIKLGEVKYKLK